LCFCFSGVGYRPDSQLKYKKNELLERKRIFVRLHPGELLAWIDATLGNAKGLLATYPCMRAANLFYCRKYSFYDTK
jgi:hypothetical protein